jgi:hypothetical protein
MMKLKYCKIFAVLGPLTSRIYVRVSLKFIIKISALEIIGIAESIVKLLPFLTCIRKVPGSNFGRDID